MPKDGFTTPIPRFKDNISALLRLTNYDLPPLQVVPPSHVVHVSSGFGDASGKQFGATIFGKLQLQGLLEQASQGHKCGVRIHVGLWSGKEEDKSSNYKELCNLVDTDGG